MFDGPAERFHRVDAVFDAALDVSLLDRTAFLDSACTGDADLSRRGQRALEGV